MYKYSLDGFYLDGGAAWGKDSLEFGKTVSKLYKGDDMSGNIIKKTRAAFLALIMITSATAAGVAFSGSVGAQEADIIVGPDNGDDYSTIQDAIEKASTDAVIEVKEKSGDYGQLTISREAFNGDGTGAASGLTIRAADGESPTISHDVTDGEPAVAIDQDGITLEGFTIKRSNSNNVAQAVRVAGDNIDLTDNTYELDESTNDAAVGVLTDSSGAAGNPSFSDTIDDVEISGGEIISEDASQTGVLVADSGDASFGGDGSVSISDVEFTANADSTHVLELDTGGGVVDTSAALEDNTFDTAASPDSTMGQVPGGFDRDGLISSTIQGAINGAASEATIKVAPGSYKTEGSVATIDTSGISLESTDGSQPTLKTTTDPNANGEPTVDIRTDGVTVDGFNIKRVVSGSGNPTQGVKIGGFEASGGSNAEVLNNDIELTDQSGNGDHPAYGVGVLDAQDGSDVTGVEISGNTISGFDGTDEDAGIGVFGFYGNDANAIIEKNTIEDNQVGISVVDSNGGADATIQRNNIIDNAQSGIFADTDSGSIDATSNWWGDPAGPDASDNTADTGGAAISGSVTYAPWADAEIDTDNPAPSLTATAFFDGSIEQNAFSSVGDAIDQATGDETIRLGVEFVEEPITVDQSDITLTGDGPDATNINYQPESPSGTATIDVRASGVTVTDLSVGRYAAGDRTSDDGHAQGIVVRESGATVENVDVGGDPAGRSEDYDRYDGIVVLDTGGNDDNIQLTDVDVSSFHAGIVVSSFDGTGVDGVDIDGGTLSDNADGLVVKSHDGADDVTDVTASNLDIENEGDIESSNGDPIDETAFLIPGESYQGYDLTPLNADSVSITRSNIVGNGEDGVVNDGVGTLDATENWWGDASGPNGEGPGSGASVSANVDFDPWLDAQAPDGETVSREGLDVTLAETAIDADGETSVESVEVVLSNGETGRDLTEQATFDSEDSTIASVSDGTITAESPGSTTITAEADGLEGSVDVRVGLIEEIEVAVVDDRIPVGESTGFTVDGTFTDGSVSEVTDNADLELELVTGEDRATIDADENEVTGDAQGAVTLEATLQGETDTAELDVFREETGDVQDNRVEFEEVESTQSVEFEGDVDDDSEVTVSEGTRPPEEAPEPPADVTPVVVPDYEVPEEAADTPASIELEIPEDRLEEVGLDEDELESRLVALREEPDGNGYDPVTIVDIDTDGSGATVTIETPGFSTFILGGSSPASGGSGGDDGGGGIVSGVPGASVTAGQSVTIGDSRPTVPGTTVTFGQTEVDAITFSAEDVRGTASVARLERVPSSAPPFDPSRPVAAVFEIEVPDERADEPATIEIELETETLDEAGLAAEDVAVLRALEEEYGELETDVEVDGDTATITAETPGFSTFVVTDSTESTGPTTDTPERTATDAPGDGDGATETPAPASGSDSGSSDGDAETPEPDAEGQPGFGAIVALVALLGAALLAAGRGALD